MLLAFKVSGPEVIPASDCDEDCQLTTGHECLCGASQVAESIDVSLGCC